MSSCPFGFSSKDQPKKGPDSLKESKIEIYLLEKYDKTLLPKKPNIYLDWWEKDQKTRQHARFCMPLLMANGLGYDILSPATFEVEWDGDESKDAKVNVLDKSSHSIVDNHSAYGSFTVQAQFIPKTEEGYFLYIKGIPNIRRPFSVMEGMIETWWNPAHFGLVCLCNHAGKFTIAKGEPLARMILINQDTIKVNLEIKDNQFDVPKRKEWLEKRCKQDKKVLDYFKGLYPDGTSIDHHIKPSVYKQSQDEV